MTAIENLFLYIDEFDVDEALAGLLSKHEAIEMQGMLAKDDYIKLSKAILNASCGLLPIEQRIRLVSSIRKGGEYIPSSDISPRDGEFIGLLIANGLIRDDVESYALTNDLSWESREFAILSSKDFCRFMTPDIVGNDVDCILKSERIGDMVKNRIVRSLDEYCENLPVGRTRSLANYLAGHGEHKVNPSVPGWLADRGVDASDIVALMQHTISDMADQDVRAVVEKIGGDYAKLLEPGREEVRMSASAGHRELLERLKTVGTVSSFSKDGGRSNCYKVYRRRR